LYGPIRLSDFGTEDDLSQSNTDGSGFRCKECRATFTKPLATTLSSSDRVETYYGCPHCLAKVSEVENHRDEQKPLNRAPLEENNLKQPEEKAKCTYSFGYLSKRSKDAPIPEECLTCSRMIECMIK